MKNSIKYFKSFLIVIGALALLNFFIRFKTYNIILVENEQDIILTIYSFWGLKEKYYDVEYIDDKWYYWDKNKKIILPLKKGIFDVNSETEPSDDGIFN